MKKLLLLLLPFIIVGIIGFIDSYINKNLKFELNGSENINIELNNNYIDAGIKASVFNHDIMKKVTISDNINTHKVGSYNVEYSISLFGNKHSLNRTVNVVDNVSPIITLNGDNEVQMHVGEYYIDDGAIAIDNIDGDITSKIIIKSNVDTNKEGKYTINYTITDSSDNKSSIQRIVNVEKRSPFDDKNNEIINYIESNNYNISIGYYNLATGKEFYYNKDKLYYGASLIKTVDALYLYDKNIINDELRPYINRAISISDNAAHRYIINYIGRENLKEYGRSLGASNTLTDFPQDNYGFTTVNDQMIYLKKLYELSKKYDDLKTMFINNNYIDINGAKVMNKYGYYAQFYHDVGIVLDTNPYIYIILTAQGYNQQIIDDLSLMIYNCHANK